MAQMSDDELQRQLNQAKSFMPGKDISWKGRGIYWFLDRDAEHHTWDDEVVRTADEQHVTRTDRKHEENGKIWDDLMVV